MKNFEPLECRLYCSFFQILNSDYIDNAIFVKVKTITYRSCSITSYLWIVVDL